MRIGSACLAIMLGACHTAPAAPKQAQAIDFVRGCWVHKDELGGILTTFLRILPDRTDPAWLSGIVTRPDIDSSVPLEMLRFARDGSGASLHLDDTPSPIFPMARLTAESPRPPRGQRAVFGALQPANNGDPVFFVAEGSGEHLHVFISTASGEAAWPIFDGERDGCD